MSKGIGKLQQRIMNVLVEDQTGDNPKPTPNGPYSTHIRLLHEKLNADSPTFKRSIRRALQTLQNRGMVRRDGTRRWCAVTSELEEMRQRRDEEFKQLQESGQLIPPFMKRR